jgi:hypothetical protein
VKRLLLTLALAAATEAAAEGLPARETAHIGPRASVGVFNPLSVPLSETLEVRGHPLLFLVSPNAVLRVRHLEVREWTLTGEYGLSVPTLAMRLTQGFLFPSWNTSDKRVGWTVVPRAGLVASHGAPSGNVLTLAADVAAGVPLGPNDATSLGTLAPLEVLLAPALAGWRAHAGALYDLPLSARLRGRAYADLYLHKARPSPVTFRVGLGLDVGVGESSRFTVGAQWWNSDQHARDMATGERHRSNDFVPTLDFIWGL